MKRFIIIALAAFIGASSIFAQSVNNIFREEDPALQDISIQNLTVEDKYQDLHPGAANVTLSIQYTPLTGEVRFYYSCLSAAFKPGEAMNTAMAVFEDFAKENNYKHYQYKSKDKTKYYKDERGILTAKYQSYVIFKR